MGSIRERLFTRRFSMSKVIVVPPRPRRPVRRRLNFDHMDRDDEVSREIDALMAEQWVLIAALRRMLDNAERAMAENREA